MDDNGAIESIDVTYIQRYLAYMDLPAKVEAVIDRNGDVDNSGMIEVIDATYIQRYLAYMDVRYPIGEYVTR